MAPSAVQVYPVSVFFSALFACSATVQDQGYPNGIPIENTSWQVLSTCSPHDCETESVAILWSEKIKTLAGQRARTEFYH
ncbi:TPA: hypothetical protein R4060_005493 [Citrobacter freundii]|uniref:Ivy family c-type lysozyme inhibitor n=1 Tax=Citrobacter freundii TaxID=546 RepID=UPI001BCF5F7E|nr:hypothetical protein [Citrobacter freundii]EKW7471479.1 hypothetical protein [Citrobacter freundii]HBH6885597.1 hypothetical protein [Citrobacter freundii]HBH6988866.1 hypothetical protein [Citrobacter freundii]HCL5572696.1 hypothetical protein [Citrobacter freundii]